MTTKLNNIVLADTASTQLSYAVTTNPNPLQISSTGSITVSVYRANPPAIQCNQLQFSVAIGTSDIALTNSANISTTCPTGWNLSSGGPGIFIFQPSGGSASIGPDGLTFEFSNIAVNDQVGGTPFKIEETVTLNNQSQSNSTSFILSKFPQTFQFRYLQVQPTSVAPGGNVTVSWSGSGGSNYDYSLSYNSTTIPNLPNVGKRVVNDLLETTVFTLTISAGENTLFQQQVTAIVLQPVIEEFDVVVNPDGTLILASSPFQLYWQTQNAEYCTLTVNGIPTGSNLPANVDTTQGYTVTAPAAGGIYSYTLTAVGSQGGSGPVKNLIINVYPIAINITSLPKQTLINADGSRLYVIGDKLTVIDTTTRTVIQTIDVGMSQDEATVSTSSIVLSPDESHLYVAPCTTDGLLKVVDTLTWQVQSVSVSGASGFMAVAMGSSSGSHLVVSGFPLNSEKSALWVLDPLNNYSVVHQLENLTIMGVMSAKLQGDQVFCIGAPPSNSADSDPPMEFPLSCYFYTVDTNALSQVAQGQSVNIPFPLIPPYITSSPDGSCYYTGGMNILGVEASAGNVLAQTPTLDFLVCGLTPSPDGTRLYVSAVSNGSKAASLYYLDTALKNSLSVYTCPFDSTPGGIAISPDGKTLYMPIAAQAPQVLVFQFL